MNALRWLLASVAGLVALSWIVLVTAGNAFRSSFGASQNGPLKTLLPIVVAVLLAVATLLPDRRLLLHLAAAITVGLLLWCIVLVRETRFVAGVVALYCAGWLWYYYRVAWDAARSVPTS